MNPAILTAAEAAAELRCLKSEILTSKETAKLLGYRVRTLKKWRSTGRGPAYVRIGSRVRYRREEINRWLDQQTVRVC